MTTHTSRSTSGVGGHRPEDFAPDLSERFDFGGLVRRMRKGWYWYVLALAVSVAIAWVYLRYTAPVYAADALILIQDERTAQGLSTEAIGAELGFETGYEVDNEIEVLKSRTLMQQVVDSLELNVTYTHVGQVRDVELFRPAHLRIRLLDSIAYDPVAPVRYGAAALLFDGDSTVRIARGEGDTSLLRYGGTFELGNRLFVLERPDARLEIPGRLGAAEGYVVQWSDPLRVAEAYSNRVAIQQVERSNVVALALKDRSPARAAAVLNSLIYFYDRSILLEGAKTGSQTLDFIGERLAEMRRELFQVESRIEGYKRDQNLAVGVSGTAADYLSRLNEGDRQLAELQVRREIIEEALSTISDPSADYEPLPLSSEVLDAQLSTLVSNYNQLIFERDNKLEAATAANPAVQTFGEQLASLRATLARSLRRVRLEILERERRLNERIAPLEQSLTAIPESERELLQLEREQAIKQNLYVFLTERREEAAITVSGQIGNTRIVESALVPAYPVSPNPTATYALALLLALALPTTVLAGVELLDDKVRDVEDVTAATGAPVLGSIVSAEQGERGIAVRPGARTMLAEQFRLLRSNLALHLGPGRETSVLTITSGSSGEGKSFIALNLGAAAALAGYRVCVVEADMRRPVFAQRLGLERVKKNQAPKLVGLADVLSGTAELAQHIHPSGVDGLDVIVGGRAHDSSAELLARPAMGAVVRQLRDPYDLVIVDTAPVGLVTDAMLLRELSDATLFVMRYGYTPKSVVRIVEDARQNGNLPEVAVVINGVERGSLGAYGKGAGYYAG